MGPHYFNLAILFFTGIILLLIIFILAIMYIRNRRGGKFQKWKLMASLLVRKAIFFDNEQDEQRKAIPVTTRLQKLLSDNQHFRKILTDELTNAKKNVSGTSADNLKQLYMQLNLHHFAIAKLKSYKWYVKAQAIQELAVMDMKEHIAKIYRFTNNANELVRMEAQIAVVKLYGFEGLRFLDVVTYPITEWQQIRLLHELAQVPAENFNGMESWLRSQNKSVITFALKLARTYHRFEIYSEIIACLQDEDAGVRLQAIETLGELYDDDTSDILISRYLLEDLRQQIAIVKVLKNIATERDIPVLLDQLNSDNAELKLMVARALANIGTKGLEALHHHRQACEYPLDRIITQIESEVAV